MLSTAVWRQLHGRSAIKQILCNFSCGSTKLGVPKILCNNVAVSAPTCRNESGVAAATSAAATQPALQQTTDAETATKQMQFHGPWPENELQQFIKDMRLLPHFISEAEEGKLLEEIEPYMKRLHYEFDHWDDAIHGFRETERKHWYPHNRTILERIREVAFNAQIMPYVHILDLAEEGVIKPHVDSTRYCGHTIAGISLLSDSVMRLVRVDAEQYEQRKTQENAAAAEVGSSNTPNDDYRHRPKASLENNFYADILLPRRSLYIMSHTSRYNFTHEILANDVSQFQGKPIKKQRRISIICRNDP